MLNVKNLKIWLIAFVCLVVIAIVVGAMVKSKGSPAGPGLMRIAESREFSAPAGGGRMMAKYVSAAVARPENESPELKTVPKMIKTAELSLSVKSVQEAMDAAQEIVKTCNGYVSSTRLTRSEADYLEGESIYKVPADSFDAAIAKLEGLGRVVSRNINTQDVSEEFMDLSVRLVNYKRQEKALLALFERTGKVLDILEVERELSRVRTEAERIEGRLRAMKSKIDYSTINVSFSQVRATVPAAATSFLDVIKGAWSAALTALAGLFSAVLVSLVWLIVFVPVGLSIIAVIWLIVRRIRKG